MADTVLQSCVTELLARLAAYTFPEIESGQGTWSVKSAKENPGDIAKMNGTNAFLYVNPSPSTIEWENVQQWLWRNEMTAQLRIARIKDQHLTAKLILPYLLMCLAENTSGTTDPLLTGCAHNQNFRDGQIIFGSARTPFIDICISFEVEYTTAINDPKSTI